MSETDRNFHELSRENYEYFQKMFSIWQSRLGQICWRVDFGFRDLSGDESYALTHYNTNGMVALVELSTKWRDREPTEINLENTAFHEVCELLITPLETLARSRKFDEDAIEHERHTIIRILENFAFAGVQK